MAASPRTTTIEWAHENGIKLWCPPVHNKHGSDPFAPRRDDKPGVADWRRRMASEPGKALYKQRAQAECPNAWARRMGLTRLSVRGKDKAAPCCCGSPSPTTCCAPSHCGGPPWLRRPEVVGRGVNSMNDAPLAQPPFALYLPYARRHRPERQAVGEHSPAMPAPSRHDRRTKGSQALSMRWSVGGIKKIPHPEEAAQAAVSKDPVRRSGRLGILAQPPRFFRPTLAE